MLLYLSLTVAAALLGGLFPALVSAAVGSLLLNWYFTPPVHTFTIADPKNIVAIAIFVAVAVSVASVVDLAARRTHQAARLRAESEILSYLAGNVLRGETSLEALLERVRRPSAWSPPPCWSARATSNPGPARAAWAPAPAGTRRTRTSTYRSATTWPSPSPAGSCPPRTAASWPPSPHRQPWSWTAAASAKRRTRQGRWRKATASARRCWRP